MDKQATFTEMLNGTAKTMQLSESMVLNLHQNYRIEF